MGRGVKIGTVWDRTTEVLSGRSGQIAAVALPTLVLPPVVNNALVLLVPPQPAVQLVAGIVADGVEGRVSLTEPVDHAVFGVIPVASPVGVTTTYLLQGIFAPGAGERRWERFEVIAVDAPW